MNKIKLAVIRRWSWKVYLLLIGLIIVAAFAIVPFDIGRQNAYTGTDVAASLGWDMILLDRLINILILCALGAMGLLLANRSGLGMPFLESRIRHQAMPYRFRSVIAIAWITAVALILLSWVLHTFVFDPPLNAMFQRLGITIPEESAVPPLYGLLAAIAASINEEIEFRLFGLSLLAWLGGLLFHEADGRPHPIVLWTANILFGLAFGAAHLPTAASLGIPLTALVVIATLVGNALAGVAFGWLYWTFGLESAMLAHFFADAIRYALVPLVTMQAAGAARSMATAGAGAVILLGLIWAGRSLFTESPDPAHPLSQEPAPPASG